MIKRSIKLIISLALVSLSVACGSVTQISGVVRDGTTGTVIQGVKVSTTSRTLPMRTTRRGQFFIDRQVRRDGVGSEPIEQRTYTIVIEHEGYERYERRVTPNSDGRGLTLTLKRETPIPPSRPHTDETIIDSTGEGGYDGT